VRRAYTTQTKKHTVKEYSTRAKKNTVKEYLESVGGKCRLGGLVHALKRLEISEDFVKEHFKVKPGAEGWFDQVSLPEDEEVIAYEEELKVKKVAKRLFQLGGTADLHDITRRNGISKKMLLSYDNGKLFEVVGKELRLAGGAFAVAAAAVAARTVTAQSGRRKARSDLFTSTGKPTDLAAAERLLWRIEGLLVSAGDGVMNLQAVYAALGLKVSHSLRRWIKRTKLKITSYGDLRVDDARLEYFRVRRAISVGALLAENGGDLPLSSVLMHVHRPPELTVLEQEEIDLASRTEPVPRVKPPGGGVPHPDYMPSSSSSSSSTAAQALRQTVGDESLALAISNPPPWVEEWVREYFPVKDGLVTFPDEPVLQPRIHGGPDVPLEPSVDEERAQLMAVAEEHRLRYGRAHASVLSGCFGVKSKWLKRFFDISVNGDALAKSMQRQTREAIMISKRIAASTKGYTDDEAFKEFGATNSWLAAYFDVDSDGRLNFDNDPAKAWKPPPDNPAPSPWTYAKLDVPRGYHRKGTGKYLPRKYGHNAVGILY
jgi:hypothetical protein